jgi:hypothetical protein
VSSLPVLALLLSLAGAPHAAPSADEQRLFAEGLKAYDAGDARGAERAWKAGYALGHDPAFLVRVGEAEEKAGAPAEAVVSYRQYLHEAPDASDRADIEQRVARLAPPSAAPPPAAEPTHELGAPAASSTVPQAPAPTAVDAEAGGAAPEDSGWNRYNITAWTGAAATVVLLGTAAFFGAEASSKESDADRLLTFRTDAGVPLAYTSDVAHQYESALADGRRDAHDARVLLLGAAGTAVVAAMFFVLDSVHTPGKLAFEPTFPSFTPATHAAGGVATWRWSF